ncbi:MAG: SH3 domain-containing protein [Anaerolineae bacterium]|nr:SH3 domain-containing protein [Anaerolineae bacterium]
MRSALLRIFALVLLFAMLSRAALPVQATSERFEVASDAQIEGPYATVRSAGATAYAGPGIGFWTLGRLRANAIVPIIGVSADRQFWQVNTPFGVVWVRNVEVIATNADNVPVIDVGLIGRVTADSVVRAGPGTQAARLSTLARGRQFFVLGTNADGSWLRIRYQFGEGWIATVNTDQAGRVSLGAPSAGAPELPRTDIPRAIVHTGALSVRSGPGDFFTTLGVLTQGESVPIIGRTSDNAWLLVESAFGTGWLNARFVRTENFFGNAPIIRYAEASANGTVAAITINATNLRSGPNRAFDVLGIVPPNTEVALLGQSRDRAWWFVRTPIGEGWISKETVRTRGGTSLVPILP